MSLRRLNYVLMKGIVPFNFGMNYESCLMFYDAHHEDMAGLCPTDPRSWSQEVVDHVNQRAKEETELINRLMKLPDDEFYAEVSGMEGLT